MSVKHTPAPWEIRHLNEDESEIVTWAGKSDGQEDPWFIAQTFGCPGDGNERANARLIAAAPELYEAIALVVSTAVISEHTHGVTLDEWVLSKARATLTKASGQ